MKNKRGERHPIIHFFVPVVLSLTYFLVILKLPIYEKLFSIIRVLFSPMDPQITMSFIKRKSTCVFLPSLRYNQ